MALTFLSPLHRASRQIAIWFEEQHPDFASSEGHLLSYLMPYGPCTVSEIVRVFGLKYSTMTSMLDRLESQGMLERTTNPEDGRSFLVGLTKKGQKAAARVNGHVQALEDAIGARVTKADLAGFQRVMEAIGKATEVEVVRRGRSPSS